ncbi:hypothetical protein WOB59_00390 [Methylocystis sp. IM4]|uniref:hypothetical protein n=1 Tax=Methylocystis sp. IM4 TaxID=3136560 RepID=UPI00311A90A2
MPVQPDWFTTDIFADGTQKVCIRARDGGVDTPLQLDHLQSQLLMATLQQIAQDASLHWAAARQAVLQGFWKTLRRES